LGDAQSTQVFKFDLSEAKASPNTPALSGEDLSQEDPPTFFYKSTPSFFGEAKASPSTPALSGEDLSQEDPPTFYYKGALDNNPSLYQDGEIFPTDLTDALTDFEGSNGFDGKILNSF
jgi:hypothetical protein